MARPRSPGYEDNRSRIIASAAQLFATRGYAGTSMNEVADACGISKATLYHYYDDKHALLLSIADNHVSRLEALVAEVRMHNLPPEPMLRELIRRLLAEYADAGDAQRVLTAEARCLQPEDALRIADKERAVVAGFAQVVLALRPDLQPAHLAKPLTMLLFGMINWLFTWMKPQGRLDHESIAQMVADLFLGGLPAVGAPAAKPAIAAE